MARHRPRPRQTPLPGVRRFGAAAAILVLAVAVLYGGTSRHEFLNYDDDTYITGNPEVTGGLSLRGLAWAFGAHAFNWHPLTWLSHMLDAQVFGAWPGGPHLVSAGLHAANAVLLLAVLTALTGAYWKSVAVALIFCLHPLRVESVAWAAERKDVLSALFWMLTLAAYMRYVRRPGPGRYLAALGLFALGLMAKPMLVTLPFVLLLLDWWPLGRAGRPESGGWSPGRLIAEKVPFFLLSLASSLVTLWVQTVGKPPLVAAALSARLANAAIAAVLYLRSLFWPAGLAPLYPYPREGISPAAVAAACAVLTLVSVVAVLQGRRRPVVLVGWLWYLGTLVPVSGVVQVGVQSRDDRYTYLTTIGVALALVWLAGGLWPRGRGARAAAAAAAVACAISLAAVSAGYIPFWRDNLTLFGYTVRTTADNSVMLNNYGIALSGAGRLAEARSALAEAVRLSPERCGTHYVLGNVLFRQGQWAEAIAAHTLALRCFSGQDGDRRWVADSLAALGASAAKLQRWTDAERYYRRLLEIAPDDPRGRENLPLVRAQQGRR